MATQLGKAYVQIIPSAEGISGSISDVLEGEATEAGTTAGQTISSRLIGVAKAALIAGGIGKIVAESISAGAELEQSFQGGLDTLYGDAADQAREYAKAASEAGITANSFAEQAVSFGAALKQSLGGDTKAAIEAANTAILDMTDNAAKMGTPIESIQAAYQGFARNQYTLLDNLKLGYGGTKGEMERLLKDAEAISGVKYDISNLSDVYSAIHVIQGELGLTGVAADEASTTISGSFEAMKAAAQNFIGYLAIGEDVGPALEQLVTSASTFLFNNLLPAVGNIIVALPETIATFLTTAMPQIIEQGLTIITSISEGLVNGIPDFISTVLNVITSMIDTFVSNLPQFIETGIKLIVNLATGLVNAIPNIVAQIPKIISSIVNGFTSMDWASVGKQVISGIANGIKNGVTAIASAAKEAAKSALNAAKNFLGIKSPSRAFRDQVGKMIDLGIAEGITGSAKAVSDSVRDLSDLAMDSFDATPVLRMSASGATQNGETDYSEIISVVMTGFNAMIKALQALNISGRSDEDIATAYDKTRFKFG